MEVACLSGKMTKAKVLDGNGKEIPQFDEIVFLLHTQLEEEIQQIISLNYQYVRNIVFENLREFIERPEIKSVDKKLITMLLLDFNASEDERLVKIHPRGFSLGADPSFLPQYFEIVEKALSNLKRIINKYLNLNDTGKLPVYEPQSYLPQNKQPVIKDAGNKKLVMDLSVPQLVALFSMFREMKIINEPVNTELARFIKANFSTKGSTDISEKTLVNLLSSLDNAGIDHWLDELKKMRIALTNLKG